MSCQVNPHLYFDVVYKRMKNSKNNFLKVKDHIKKICSRNSPLNKIMVLSKMS